VAAFRVQTPGIVVRFALYAGVALAIAVAGGAWFARSNATNEARDDTRSDAAFLADRLGHDDLARTAFLWPRGPQGAALTAQLDEFLDPQNTAKDVVGISLATPDGVVTYASDHARIGRRLASVPKGVHVVRVLETWVPVYWTLNAQQARGFLGFDRDYEPVAASMHSAFLVQTGAIALALLLLYLAMLPIMHRLTAKLAAALAERKQLAAIVEHSNDAIVGRDRDGLITSWNAAAERLYGWRAESVIGKTIDFLVPLAPPDGLDELVGKRELHIRNGGQLVVVSTSISPIRDDDGELVGSSLIVRDVGAVASLERELREAQRQEAVARFATAIASELEGLVADLAPTDAGARGVELVRRLQELGSPTPVQLEELNVNELVLGLRTRLEVQLGDGMELLIAASAPHARINADRKRLQRVLLDLTMGSRGAASAEGVLTIRTADSGGSVAVSVSRPSESHAEQLGLALVNAVAVVEASGGTIEIDTDPAAQTTVTIRLPRAGAALERVA
jgi:PAS domain S-box-containing protein